MAATAKTTSKKKTAAKKAVRKAPAAKKPGAKKKPASQRKYGPKASEAVETEMREMKRGTLRSSSGQKVTDPKQAIAIGLSEARRKGAKVPKKP